MKRLNVYGQTAYSWQYQEKAPEYQLMTDLIPQIKMWLWIVAEVEEHN